MAAPRQMTANTLNALKGWPSQSALDFHAKFDATHLGRELSQFWLVQS